jgi:hypothetical protein
MMLRLRDKILAAYAPEMENDRSRLAAYYVELQAHGLYSWKDACIRELRALSDPFIDEMLKRDLRGVSRNINGELLLDAKLDVASMRRAIESCLIHRKVRAVLWDEANHVLKVGPGPKQLYLQMESIKSRAYSTSAVHVLAGTYELLDMTHQDEQVCRRHTIVHLPRYQNMQDPEQRTAFRGVLKAFQSAMPLADKPDLVGHWEYLYERSIGCVGILKEWLDRALISYVGALRGDNPPMQEATYREHLEATAKTDLELVSILETVLEGEERMHKAHNDMPKVRALLRKGALRLYDGAPKSPDAAATVVLDALLSGGGLAASGKNGGTIKAGSGEHAPVSKSGKSTRPKPGHRINNRDAVGGIGTGGENGEDGATL